MDALSDVLRAVKLTGAVFLDAEFHDPWCVAADGALLRQRLPGVEHFVYYHYLAAGRCHAQVRGGESALVDAGQIVVFPQGDAHLMASAPELAPTSIEAVLARSAGGALTRLRHGGSGEATRLVCGFLACDPRLCRPLLAALPRLMTVRLGEGAESEWHERSIERSLAEAGAARAGSQALLARLSELLFVETLRRYLEGLPPDQGGWFAGLRDPFVGRGLALLHRDSAQPWTVERLAREVGCSRSVLAERFTHFIGQSPMRYLARWRLATAAGLLKGGDARLAQVAQQVGYESETAFNRAFKREYGVPPKRWRQHAGAAPR